MNRFVPAVFPLLWPAMIAAQATLNVTAFDDHNRNGRRDPGERPIPNVVISNQRDVATTDASGIARIEHGPTGIVFVSTPNGYRSVGPFWRVVAPTDSQLTFALQPAPAPRTFSFVHASDPHIEPANVDRTRRLRQLVDSIRPSFTLITGDLVRDAMSQQEPLARSYFELFDAETRGFASPVWTVPGNHDHFGIIRSRSHVAETHLVSAWELLAGFADMPLVASIRRDNGKTTDRHTVANVLDVITAMRGHRWVLALGGHMHAAEKLIFQTEGVLTRFEQAAAVVGGGEIRDVIVPSGITLYTVRDGSIDAGRFIRVDPPSKPPGR